MAWNQVTQTPSLLMRLEPPPQPTPYHHIGVERQRFSSAEQDILREYGDGLCQPQSRGNLPGAKAVRDPDHDAARLDDAEINCHGLGGHRHDDRQRIAGSKPASHQVGRHPIGQRCQLADTHRPEFFAFALVDDGRGIRGSCKAALHDVESRIDQPARGLHAVRSIHHPAERLPKTNAQPPDRQLPVRFATPDRPRMNCLVRVDAGSAHQPRNVCRRNELRRWRPGWLQCPMALEAVSIHRLTPFAQ